MSLQLVPRERMSSIREAAIILLSVTAAVLLAALLFALVGAPPARALWALVKEPFGSAYGFSETLLVAIPLTLCGLAVGLARKMGLWNIGAEGQLYAGAVGASLVALHEMPFPLALPMALLAAFVAGGAWASIAGVLKVRLGVNEILSTLMLNYVAIAGTEHLVYGPWKGSDGFPYTEFFSASSWLPGLWGRVHAGLFLAFGAALLLHLVERHTPFGYEIRVAGASSETARYAGIPVMRRVLAVMALAGGAAGLAGASVVLGVEHRLHAGISPGYGYTAIIVAFLARGHLLGVVVSALLFAALIVGGDGLPMSFPGVSSSVVEVFQALVLLMVLIGGTLSSHRLVWRRG